MRKQPIWLFFSFDWEAYNKTESGTEIGNSLEFDFVVPPSTQLSRAVKTDEISVVEPTQQLRLARQSKDN